MYSDTIVERFWAKVDRREARECWEWRASKTEQGYGKLGRGTKKSGWEHAHRVSWWIANGPIEDGLWVLHRCDNPSCVNPDHLFLGTVQDNNADMKQKGRRCFAPRAKLSERQVREIKYRHSVGVPAGRLARDFAVTNATISLIVTGQIWAEIEAFPSRG